jgi:cellulose 1,4-beta-cellobiosidase
MGDTQFYGKGSGFKVDTGLRFTVITQFVGSPIREIRRFYAQKGRLIPNSNSTIPGVTGNSITPAFCDAQKKVFGDNYGFKEKGGFEALSQAASKGMVLVMSLWDDMYDSMNWLDSTEGNSAGAKRGACGPDVGKPANVRSTNPNAKVTYSNIRYGPLGSTYKGLPTN